MGDFRASAVARLIFVILCTASWTAGTGIGKCPIYPPLPSFDIQRMTGTWYEVERSFHLMELSVSCTELNLSINDRGFLYINVKTVNRWTGTPSTSFGVGIPSHNGSSVFRYRQNSRMPYALSRLLPGAGQYNVLFTDYTRFAIVWSCSSVGIAHADRIWVLGRTREISADVRAQIYAIMAELNLDPDRLIVSKNINCTQYTTTTAT